MELPIESAARSDSAIQKLTPGLTATLARQSEHSLLGPQKGGWWSILLLPLATSVILLIPTVLFWAHERSLSAEFTQSRVSQYRIRLARRVQTEIGGQLRPLRRLRDEIASGDIISAQTFASSAHSISREEPALRYIAWIGVNGHVISASPPGTLPNVEAELADLEKAGPAQLFAGLSRLPDGMLLSFPADVPARAADRVILLPVIRPGSSNVEGAVVASESSEAMLGEMVPPGGNGPFTVRLEDERGQILFANGFVTSPMAGEQGGRGGQEEKVDTERVPVLDQFWSISVAAVAPGSRKQPAGEADAFLLSGLVLSLLGGATVAQTMRHRRREQHRTQNHLAALEALHIVAATISCKPRSEVEVFERLLGAACDLLRMPMGMICELEADDHVRLAEQVGFDPPLVWENRILAEFPMMSRSSRSGEMVVVDGQHADLSLPQYAAMRRRNLTSMLMFPLSAGEDRIGIMMLCDETPRSFSDEDLRLARLWASQAAVTLANQRLAAANEEALKQQQLLNQQIRQDADAKAMLLRELNHRVKNNLAGIVGLLSAGAPELPEQAQQWLDRAIVRIETLARAHELFVGTSSELGLADLVSKTMVPIYAIKPADVRITLDLSPVNDPLDTDQAVTLAMVVHELASNALTHGLSHRGNLIVRARRTIPGWAAIEVIDDGTRVRDETASDNGSDANPVATIVSRTTQTGIGLQLVRGLVGRELHGTFSMRESESGGTIATVDFPITHRSADI